MPSIVIHTKALILFMYQQHMNHKRWLWPTCQRKNLVSEYNFFMIKKFYRVLKQMKKGA